MNKLVVPGVLVLVAGAYFGVTGYVSSRAESGLDELARAVAPIATLTYKDVSTSFDGSITVEQIRLNNFEQGIDVRIEQGWISTGNFLALLKLEKTLQAQRYPEDLELRLEHISTPLDLIPDTDSSDSPVSAYLSKVGVAGCSDLTGTELSDLETLGYQSMDVSVGVRMHQDKRLGALVMDIDLNWHDAMRIQINSALKGVQRFADINPEYGMNPSTVDVDGSGYSRRFVRHCAELNAVSAEDFVNTHLQLVRQELERADVQLGDSVYEAYRRMIADGALLTVTIAPDDKVAVENIELYPPSSYARILGLGVAVDGTPIDLEMNWKPKKLRAVARRSLAAPDKDAPAAVVVPAEQAKPQFVAIEADTLDRYVNGHVRLRTSSDKRFDGRLVKVDKGVAEVNVRFGSGSATLPVRIADIEEAQVFK